MKIKLLSIIIFIAIAATGCLKDSSQPVTHINDVNISLTGTWTQLNGNINYYDETGKIIFAYNPPLLSMMFDGSKTFNEIDAAGGKVTGSYTITTGQNIDYINLAGSNTGPHKLQIVNLQSRRLTLSETILYPAGSVITANNHNITYYKSVQVDNYSRNDLPQN